MFREAALPHLLFEKKQHKKIWILVLQTMRKKEGERVKV